MLASKEVTRTINDVYDNMDWEGMYGEKEGSDSDSNEALDEVAELMDLASKERSIRRANTLPVVPLDRSWDEPSTSSSDLQEQSIEGRIRSNSFQESATERSWKQGLASPQSEVKRPPLERAQSGGEWPGDRSWPGTDAQQGEVTRQRPLERSNSGGELPSDRTWLGSAGPQPDGMRPRALDRSNTFEDSAQDRSWSGPGRPPAESTTPRALDRSSTFADSAQDRGWSGPGRPPAESTPPRALDRSSTFADSAQDRGWSGSRPSQATRPRPPERSNSGFEYANDRSWSGSGGTQAEESRPRPPERSNSGCEYANDRSWSGSGGPQADSQRSRERANSGCEYPSGRSWTGSGFPQAEEARRNSGRSHSFAEQPDDRGWSGAGCPQAESVRQPLGRANTFDANPSDRSSSGCPQPDAAAQPRDRSTSYQDTPADRSWSGAAYPQAEVGRQPLGRANTFDVSPGDRGSTGCPQAEASHRHPGRSNTSDAHPLDRGSAGGLQADTARQPLGRSNTFGANPGERGASGCPQTEVGRQQIGRSNTFDASPGDRGSTGGPQAEVMRQHSSRSHTFDGSSGDRGYSGYLHAEGMRQQPGRSNTFDGSSSDRGSIGCAQADGAVLPPGASHGFDPNSSDRGSIGSGPGGEMMYQPRDRAHTFGEPPNDRGWSGGPHAEAAPRQRPPVRGNAFDDAAKDRNWSGPPPEAVRTRVPARSSSGGDFPNDRGSGYPQSDIARLRPKDRNRSGRSSEQLEVVRPHAYRHGNSFADTPLDRSWPGHGRHSARQASYPASQAVPHGGFPEFADPRGYADAACCVTPVRIWAGLPRQQSDGSDPQFGTHQQSRGGSPNVEVRGPEDRRRYPSPSRPADRDDPRLSPQPFQDDQPQGGGGGNPFALGPEPQGGPALQRCCAYAPHPQVYDDGRSQGPSGAFSSGGPIPRTCFVPARPVRDPEATAKEAAPIPSAKAPKEQPPLRRDVACQGSNVPAVQRRPPGGCPDNATAVGPTRSSSAPPLADGDDAVIVRTSPPNGNAGGARPRTARGPSGSMAPRGGRAAAPGPGGPAARPREPSHPDEMLHHKGNTTDAAPVPPDVGLALMCSWPQGMFPQCPSPPVDVQPLQRMVDRTGAATPPDLVHDPTTTCDAGTQPSFAPIFAQAAEEGSPASATEEASTQASTEERAGAEFGSIQTAFEGNRTRRGGAASWRHSPVPSASSRPNTAESNRIHLERLGSPRTAAESSTSAGGNFSAEPSFNYSECSSAMFSAIPLTMNQGDLLAKDIEHWDEEDVAQWVTSFFAMRGNIEDVIVAHAINGQVMLSLSEADISDLGIEKFGHRRILMIAARKLRMLRATQLAGQTDCVLTSPVVRAVSAPQWSTLQREPGDLSSPGAPWASPWVSQASTPATCAALTPPAVCSLGSAQRCESPTAISVPSQLTMQHSASRLQPVAMEQIRRQQAPDLILPAGQWPNPCVSQSSTAPTSCATTPARATPPATIFCNSARSPRGCESPPPISVTSPRKVHHSTSRQNPMATEQVHRSPTGRQAGSSRVKAVPSASCAMPTSTATSVRTNRVPFRVSPPSAVKSPPPGHAARPVHVEPPQQARRAAPKATIHREVLPCAYQQTAADLPESDSRASLRSCMPDVARSRVQLRRTAL